MALLDQFGNAIDTKRLLQEEAAPSLIGTRQVVSNHPSRGLTPERLASILLQAEEGDSQRYFELGEDMEEKDLHYLGVLGTRKRAVSQLELSVEAASDAADDVKIADDLRDWLRRDTLSAELFDILDAIGKGVSCSEICWELTAKRWRPARIIRRDPRFFEFSRDDGETLLLREAGQLVPLAPFKYIVHVAKAKSGLAVRGGLARAVSWIWLFKNFSIKDWVAFGEVFGQPYRIGKYEPNATPEDKAALLRAVASVGSDAAAIIPTSMVVEFVEAAKSGSIDVYDRVARFFDEQLSKAVLGQTTTTEVTQGGGSRALGEVHAGVAQDIRDSDALSLMATLNRDLVRPYVDLNYGPRERYPRLFIGRADELTLKERLDYTFKFVMQGMKVETSEVRDRLGWSDPEEGEDVLMPARTAMAPTPPPAINARRSTLQKSVQASDAIAAGDAIDQQVRDALADDEWVPVIDEVLRPVRELLNRAASLEEVRAQLLDVVSGTDATQLTDLLERVLLPARLAGELEIPLTADGG